MTDELLLIIAEQALFETRNEKETDMDYSDKMSRAERVCRNNIREMREQIAMLASRHERREIDNFTHQHQTMMAQVRLSAFSTVLIELQ